MQENNKPLGIDGDGYELVTEAVKTILNEFPGLATEVRFEQLEENSGIAFSADSGALILSEKKSVTGKVTRVCNYPFYVVCRASGNLEVQKLAMQSLLDKLGRWICMERVNIDGMEHVLAAYPDLSDGRKIIKISRMNSYGLEPNENDVQDWLLPCTLEYRHIFKK